MDRNKKYDGVNNECKMTESVMGGNEAIFEEIASSAIPTVLKFARNKSAKKLAYSYV